jgi:hypothetical protein
MNRQSKSSTTVVVLLLLNAQTGSQAGLQTIAKMKMRLQTSNLDCRAQFCHRSCWRLLEGLLESLSSACLSPACLSTIKLINHSRCLVGLSDRGSASRLLLKAKLDLYGSGLLGARDRREQVEFYEFHFISFVQVHFS